jgi:hypothetical protein
MNENQLKIFTATAARTIVKKLMNYDEVQGIMPVSSDFISNKFEEEAKKIQFNFQTLEVKDLCEKMFLIGFIFSVSRETVSENEIENAFKFIESILAIPYQLNMSAFIWFRQGNKVGDSERESFSVLYNLSRDICQKFGVTEPAPLPSMQNLDNLFKALDKSIFDDIDIDNEVIGSTFAQISFQSGFILGLNMGNELDDDLLDVAFSEIFEDIFREAEQHENSRLIYFILFREGFHKALTGTR